MGPLIYALGSAASRALPWLIGGAAAYTTGYDLQRLADERSSSRYTDYATGNYSQIIDGIEVIPADQYTSTDLIPGILPAPRKSITHVSPPYDPSVGKNERQSN